MAFTEQRPGVSPTLPHAPFREDPLRTQTHRSLRETTARWKHTYGRRPVELDTQTLRPRIFSESVLSSAQTEPPVYLRYLLNLANDGEQLRALFLHLRSMEKPEGLLLQFALAWEREGATRTFEVVVPDMFWTDETAIARNLGEPVHSIKIADVDRHPAELDFTEPIEFPNVGRISGLRGALATQDPQAQKQLASDLVMIVNPAGQRISI